MKKHGCCTDKECTLETCMELPEGKTCGDCEFSETRSTMFGCKPSDTHCDFFPRKFNEKTVKTTQIAMPIKLHKKLKLLAANQGVTLKALILAVLEKEVEDENNRK